MYIHTNIRGQCVFLIYNGYINRAFTIARKFYFFAKDFLQEY